jgi:ADP-ribosylglycohydrolase
VTEKKMITKQSIENGIYGLAIGDALGVPYEFYNRESMAKNPCVNMIGYGSHNQPAGTWSDDTSLTLATLDGLSEMTGCHDYGKIMDKFSAWLFQNEYTLDKVFDVGRTTLQAISRYRHGEAPVACGGNNINDNGNGSLMRILPAIFYTLSKNQGNIDYAFIEDISALTHGHVISKVACKIYANIVKLILENKSKDELLVGLDIFDQIEFAELRARKFSSLSGNQIKSGGFVVDTLVAALWCFLSTENYKDCVLKAVNLGNDTDTVAAVAGGLAGLYYGKNTIPTSWLDTLRGKDLIEKLINKFYDTL